MSKDFSFKLVSENFVYLCDEDLDLRYKLNESLGHKYNSVLFLSIGSLADDIRHLHGDIQQSLLLVLYFFADQHEVDPCSQGAFESNVRSRSSH